MKGQAAGVTGRTRKCERKVRVMERGRLWEWYAFKWRERWKYRKQILDRLSTHGQSQLLYHCGPNIRTSKINLLRPSLPWSINSCYYLPCLPPITPHPPSPPHPIMYTSKIPCPPFSFSPDSKTRPLINYTYLSLEALPVRRRFVCSMGKDCER